MSDQLKRRIGPVLLTLYGIGIMVGAGIYVLTGAAAGAAGVWAPLAFVLAAVVAVPTALSFCELSVRIPEAAADSSYIEKGLNRHALAVLVGWINIVAGTVAAAAVLRGGVGYLLALVDLPFVWAVIGLGAALTVVAIVGVVESLAFAAVLTLVEVLGLALVIGAGFSAEPVADWTLPAPAPHWAGIMTATVFAFFAYIGFDDMANMAEEARDPGRTMPRAILAALTVTGILYCLVALAAVRVVPQDVLGASERPLAIVWEAGTGRSGAFLSAIAVAAALNGVLAQIVMASRVLFGLGKRSRALAVFRSAHPRFGTPVLASLLVGVSVVGAAMTLPVATLAEFTSQALLIVFSLVNASLIALDRRERARGFDVAHWVPWLGLFACLAAFFGSFWG
ncbi:APC family permease [Thalassococcus sp. CAU 1522]|uniref:APC family permease n=1 Tax=Thalassococcus arenae TaxID=2851652 RepID=A0ABS6N949_9RHOB|nr:APC family permease [Thalassococcus arenae]MBV2360522.1 APC family permease [Thalassococcus arenae]